jgi:hypothetical protein
LHTRRSGSFQYRQHQLDVGNIACYAIINLRLCFSIGIVIISVISLFVSRCSPCVSTIPNRIYGIGVLLWNQGSQLVGIVTSIRNNRRVSLTFFRYQNCAWIPFLLVFVVATGVSGKHFVNTPAAPATAAQIFSFGAALAGGTISWAGISSDYTAYFHPRVSRFVKFYCGLYHDLIFKR